MSGWSGLIWDEGRDPLVILLVLALVGTIAAQLIARRYPLAKAVVRVVFLVLLTIAFVRSGIVPYKVQPSPGDPFLDSVHRIVKAAWWLWAAWFVVGMMRAFVIVERRPRESRLLQDILAGVTYLTAVFAIAAYVLDLPVQGLLATSGVLAIILGLALQSTLSDLFSGIVLDFSRPYVPGDVVNFEGSAAGRVIEMNWRATHILTERRDLAIIPNSTIAKSRITNISSPSTIHGVTITVQLDAGTQPALGREAIEHALLNCRAICVTPPPSVAIKTISANAIEFEVTFFVEGLTAATATQNELFDLIYRHAVASGLSLALAPNSLPRPPAVAAPAMPGQRLVTLVGMVAIFRTLTPEEQSTVAARLKFSCHDTGTILAANQSTTTLFIIAEGVISAIREPEEIELGRMGPGDYYGDIGMLTGEAPPVRFEALTPVVIYELTKGDLAPILEARPQVAQEMSRIIALRIARSRLGGTSEVDESVPTHQLGEWFLDRLHRLFNLSTADTRDR